MPKKTKTTKTTETEEPVPPQPRRCACGQISHHADGWCGSNCTFSSSPPKPAVYPEHERLKEVRPRSQSIGEFVEWLSDEKCATIAVRIEGGDMVPIRTTLQNLLAEFFEIDQDKLELEKQDMIAELRGETVVKPARARARRQDPNKSKTRRSEHGR